jgi:hypothetical protein
MGYVYLMSNASMPGLVKVGCTDRSPEERLLELSSATGVPTAFRLEFFAAFRDCVNTEAKIHATLSSERVTSTREFFRVPVEYAKYLIIEALQDELMESMATWREEDVVRLVARIRATHPTVAQSNVAEVLSRSDEELMVLVDQIFSARPKVRNQFR